MLFFKFRPTKFIYIKRSTKYLKVGLIKTGGRTKKGFITSFKKSKTPFNKIYRFIDFWRTLNLFGFVICIKYDSCRTCKIALICYTNGYLTYNLAVESLNIGYRIFSGNLLKDVLFLGKKYNYINFGNTLPLKYIPIGTLVCAIELWSGRGAQYCRSAGTSALILKKENNLITLKLRSGWKILISENCYATIGVISNINHKYKIIKKAGTNINLGKHVTVRGISMNPIDHPHGGGRGKTSGHAKSFSPWGKSIKGRKTINNSIFINKNIKNKQGFKFR